MSTTNIHDLALGKWRNLLPELGVHERFLDGRHGPCPICGGNDRFRFDNKAGRGSWFCSKCGAGSGIDLAMKVNGWDFRTAYGVIIEKVGGVKPEPFERTRKMSSERFVAQWRASMRLDGHDPASRYLMSRGIQRPPSGWPAMLRFSPKATYFDEKTKAKSSHPAMLALYVDPGAEEKTVHYTFLTEDGRKAKVEKPKKVAPCKIPAGGAVRLAPSAPRMGIAEGIETALSASAMWGIPVWAALSAGRLVRWEPPPNARDIVIFGDNDMSYAGQNAAYALAHRLSVDDRYRSLGLKVTVELPPDVETDWNDVLSADQIMGVAA